MASKAFGTWGFESFSDYKDTLKCAYHEIPRRVISPMETLEEAPDKTPLPRTLNWFHVGFLGVGLIVGAGIFVSTGQAAAEMAGPAVVIAFVVAGVSAILSSLCYSEFAVRFPLSGGAFNYMLFSCGELVAFCCVCTLILEYVLANAAVARSFSPYLGQLIGKGSHFFNFEISESLTIDPLAAGLVVLCVGLATVSTANSSIANIGINVVCLAMIFMIMIVGFVKGKVANVQPFVPPEFGVKGIFNAASFVFFSFIGFDAVSTMAEEVVNPARDMPIGIMACITFVTVLYVLMSLSLVLMVPYAKIDTRAAFPAAFQAAGMPWMRVIVSIGALLAIITGVLVGVLAVSRILSAVGRAHLVLPVLGNVHPKWGTPAVATIALGIPTVVLALLSDLPMLINLVSAGTLFVFGMVALGLLIKRYTLPMSLSREVGPPRRMLRTALIALLLFNAVALGVTYNFDVPYWTFIILVGLQLAFTVALHMFAVQAPKPAYVAPLFPYVPSASLMINAWLCSTLPAESWWHFAVFLAVVTFVYFTYSCAGSLALEEHSLKRRGVSYTGKSPDPGIVRIVSQAPDTGDLVYMPPSSAGLGDAKALEGTKATDAAV